MRKISKVLYVAGTSHYICLLQVKPVFEKSEFGDTIYLKRDTLFEMCRESAEDFGFKGIPSGKYIKVRITVGEIKYGKGKGESGTGRGKRSKR